MTLRIVNFDSVGAGIRVDLALGENLWIAPDVIVGTTDDYQYTIRVSGSAHTMHVYGTVVANFLAIGVGVGSMDTYNRLVIEAGALVQNFNDLSMAIQVGGTKATLINKGTIIGGVNFLGVAATGQSTLTNDGLIESDWAAVGRNFSTTNMETVVFVNNGTARGGQWAYMALPKASTLSPITG
ncbi:hypothetical protein [Microvirga terricola]|uniref:Uncharacterized protein n=1 Tax=Microvirga terricola TaxID=2719797 RepID=A0ABX0VCJ0_9HYPH|nr:hypothetical protein [Microvirga terricola]NIX77126.1 hypothetical protein [Microvirga terricola]